MSYDWKIYLQDIDDSCKKVLQYTSSLSKEQFIHHDMTYDAVLRNLEIIGEAAKRIPDDMRSKYPAIEWRKIAGIRDVVIHAYHAIDNDIIWDVVQTEIPRLLKNLDD